MLCKLFRAGKATFEHCDDASGHYGDSGAFGSSAKIGPAGSKTVYSAPFNPTRRSGFFGRVDDAFKRGFVRRTSLRRIRDTGDDVGVPLLRPESWRGFDGV